MHSPTQLDPTDGWLSVAPSFVSFCVPFCRETGPVRFIRKRNAPSKSLATRARDETDARGYLASVRGAAPGHTVLPVVAVTSGQ